MLMKKILSVLAVIMTTFFIVACTGNSKAPEKTPAELRADSIAKAKKDSVAKVANFKKIGIGYLERYLKNQCSSDPSVGKVLKKKTIYLVIPFILDRQRYLLKTDMELTSSIAICGFAWFVLKTRR